jgi:hypothetical protein
MASQKDIEHTWEKTKKISSKDPDSLFFSLSTNCYPPLLLSAVLAFFHLIQESNILEVALSTF